MIQRLVLCSLREDYTTAHAHKAGGLAGEVGHGSWKKEDQEVGGESWIATSSPKNTRGDRVQCANDLIIRGKLRRSGGALFRVRTALNFSQIIRKK